ncbi:MAG: SCO family protein [Acidobacteria bacterium]|nr:SCO family protein [Acidobacteriota bacterium]
MTVLGPRGALVGALLLPMTSGCVSLRAEPELPVLAELPAFTLAGHDGRPVTLEGLRGRPWVADFIFTRCGGVCPVLTAQMARLERRAPRGAAFVSFTVDPDHDTPEVLARYARQHAAGDRWVFVTGPKAALHELSTEGFKLAAFEVPPGEQGGGDGPFLHSGKLVLVDGRGCVRGYYDSEDGEDLEALAADLARVVRENPSSGRGGVPSGREGS